MSYYTFIKVCSSTRGIMYGSWNTTATGMLIQSLFSMQSSNATKS